LIAALLIARGLVKAIEQELEHQSIGAEYLNSAIPRNSSPKERPLSQDLPGVDQWPLVGRVRPPEATDGGSGRINGYVPIANG
jgi:hypothetical protein